jgi:ankyrin repeat protein
VLPVLLKCGADANKRNYFGLLPLPFACYYQEPTVLNLLLEHGADPMQSIGEGNTVDLARALNRFDLVELMNNKKGSV